MAKYGMTIDVERCTGCYSCFLSCKDEFAGNDYFPWSAAQPDAGPGWIQLQEVEHGAGSKVKVDYVPHLCQHCEDAPCMKPEFGDAVYRRADGIVVIDPVKARGRKEIADACPYGAIQWNEEAQLAQKCTFCAHRLDQGESMPRCVEACPTQALVFGDLDDPGSAVSQKLAEKAKEREILKPELGARPLVTYFGLPKPFIAGEVVLADKPGECAVGVKVTLQSKATQKTTTAQTDFLGDFEFKGLDVGGRYVLRAECKGYQTKEVEAQTDISVNLGEVVLAVEELAKQRTKARKESAPRSS